MGIETEYLEELEDRDKEMESSTTQRPTQRPTQRCTPVCCGGLRCSCCHTSLLTLTDLIIFVTLQVAGLSSTGLSSTFVSAENNTSSAVVGLCTH